jgi:hypothetical protein
VTTGLGGGRDRRGPGWGPAAPKGSAEHGGTSLSTGEWVGLFVLGVVLGVLLFFACRPLVGAAAERLRDGRPTDGEVDDARHGLLVRSSAESMSGTSGRLVSEIQRELGAVTEISGWVDEPATTGTTGCSAAEVEVGGVVSETLSSRAAVRLGPDQVRGASEAVTSVAIRHGYTGRGPMADGDEPYAVPLVTDRGGTVTLGTEGQLVVTVTSDCYLTAERAAELVAEQADR